MLCEATVLVFLQPELRVSPVFSSRWKSGFRTAARSKRRTRERTRTFAPWSQKRPRPAASSDCWSRAGCWPLPACQGSCLTAAVALWARPCGPPPWLWPPTGTAAEAAAAAARQVAVLRCRPLPVRGQWRGCRARRRHTASSISPCRPYWAALPHGSPQTPSPWLAHWPATYRNSRRATWAPLPSSLTRGPMGKNPWTRKFWNDAFLKLQCGFFFSLSGCIFMAVPVFVWFGHLSIVLLCSSSCVPAHVEPVWETKTRGLICGRTTLNRKILHTMFRQDLKTESEGLMLIWGYIWSVNPKRLSEPAGVSCCQPAGSVEGPTFPVTVCV